MSMESTSKRFSYGDTGTALYRTDEADRELFDRQLRSWMPPDSFDVHAHLYDLRHIVDHATSESFHGPAEIRYPVYRAHQQSWLGDRMATGTLFFPFPTKTVDTVAANKFLLAELREHPQLAGLMLVRPTDDPADIEAQVARDGWVGFKVYHLLAARQDTFRAETSEFLPDWVWEIAERRSLLIMLHMVLDKALADPRNQTYIVERCRRFPHAKLVLAHAARGFCAAHTVAGIDALRGLRNVWFDTSAICEAPAFEAILRTFGTTRLMFGSDFPVSDMRGHAMSLGDGFWWLYENAVDFSHWTLGRPTKIGLQSLLALQQACRTLHLRETDLEHLFSSNARRLIAEARGDMSRSDAPIASGPALYREAKRLIPGGTQLLSKRPEQFAPEQWPAYYAETRGCEVVDLDGREYLDFTHNGVGSCLLGYAHPDVNAAVIRRVTLGSMSTLNNPEEVALARKLIEWHAWADNVRFARCGGESMAIAARIARAATRRDVIAFCGYHGWQDWYLAANLGETSALDGHLLPGLSPSGVPRGLIGTARPFAYNNIDSLRAIAREHLGQLAAVIMEPTRNTPPEAGFLSDVRQLCDEHGAKLIFDEVTTGLRFNRGGVHLTLGVEPDVAVFAKALGNGHPIGAIIGKAATMQAAQESFISSTYWTEGVGFAAALATLDVMQRIDVPSHVQRIGESFRAGVASVAAQHELPLKLSGYPALTTIGFEHSDSAALVTLLTVRMLARGILAGGGFYPTLAHQPEHIESYLTAADEVFAELAAAIRSNDIVARIGGPVKHSGFARLT